MRPSRTSGFRPMRACLLAATALAAVAADAREPTDPTARKPHAAHAPAQAPVRTGGPRPAAARPANVAESVTVVASRSVSHGAENVISKSVTAQFTPGVSPYKVLDRLPGVSFSSTDPLGIDTWGTSVYLRGFFMDQIGVTLDGIPLNDQTYETNNGVNIIQAVISDNIDRTVTSEGPGGVGVPSTSTLGGTIQFETADPPDRRGGKISQGFGSNDSYRTYLRLDTGRLNATGTKASVSYARSDEQLWMGAGHQFQQQAEAKLVQPIGQESSMKAFFNWSSLAEWGYQDTSLSIIDGLGWRVPHLYPDYALAYRYAQARQGGTYILPITDAIVANDQEPYLYDGGQAEVDYTGGLNLDLMLTERLRWLTTLYGQSDTGYYTYADYGTPSDNGAPFSEQVGQTRQERYGVHTRLQYDLGRHSISTGVWFENNNQQADLFWYNEPLLGAGPPLKTVGPYDVYGPAFLQGYGFAWHTNNFTYHLEDVWHPRRDLRLVAGFKSMIATTAGGATYNNPDYTGADALPNGGLTASAAFLPHLGATWTFLRHHELYFDLAENMRSYQVLPNGIGNSLWSVQDQQTFAGLRDTVKPERDWVYAVGYRYNGPFVQASLAGYHADARHRLQAVSEGTITAPVSSVTQTRVGIYGVDAALTLRPVRGFEFYNSVSYNHSVYDGDIVSQGEVYDTDGRKIVNYPQFMYKTNLSYRWRRLEVHFDAHYYSKRYFSYVNDTSVPGYWLTSTGARYDLGRVGPVRNLMFDFNVYNLLNSKYVSMMGQNGNPLSGDYQSLERGAVRQFFGTVSAEF